MTNSYRKPYEPIVCTSPLGLRQYKRIRARTERARVRTAINSGEYDIDYELNPWNDWDCPNDGKKQLSDDDKLRRK